MNKMLLIDGNAVLHRAYYALPDWRNRSGEATAGVYGFLSILLKAIEDLKPTHLAVVFDCPEPTFRHSMYVGYQSNREKERQVSEDIWGQVEKLKVVFEKMNVPVFAVPGFEADDVLGTISQQVTKSKISPNPSTTSPLTPLLISGEGNQNEVVIITGDRDLMQLVNEKVKLYMPFKGVSDMVLIDEAKVMERLGVHPDRVVDYKGLVGDSSDNYPGVAGIGPKTAIHLLAEYGSFENIYHHLSPNPSPKLRRGETERGEVIPESVTKKLVDGYEGGKLSKELATIRKDVPVTLDLEKSQIPGEDKMLAVLAELGYKSLIKRITGLEAKIDDNQSKLFQ